MAITFLDNFKELLGFAAPYAIIHVAKSGKKSVVLAFDSIQETEFTADTQITTYPTEYNIEMTDYKFRNPNTITVRGVIQRDSFAGEMISSALSAYGGGKSLIDRTRAQLERYCRVICRLDIQTKSGLYQNYSLKGYKVPESYDNYGYYEAVMTFQENLVNPNLQKNIAKISDSDTIFGGICSKLELKL